MRDLFALLFGLVLVNGALSDRAFAKGPNDETAACEISLGAPTVFASLGEAVTTIGAVRIHLVHYLTPPELGRLDALLANAPAVTADADPSIVESTDLVAIAELFERSKQNFLREFREQAALADEAIAARIKAAHRREVDRELSGALSLRAKFKNCRQQPTFERCAATWRRIQNELKSKLKKQPRTYATKAATGTGLPIDEVFRLDVLGSEDQKDVLRQSLTRTFHSPGAEARQAKRDDAEEDGRGRRHEYTKVTNLNRALGFFLSPPRIIERTSKVMLNGPARVGARILNVNVVFDPRDRYVTIQVPDGIGDQRYYYRLNLLGDGRVEILDEAPLAKGLVYENLRDTHLAY